MPPEVLSEHFLPALGALQQNKLALLLVLGQVLLEHFLGAFLKGYAGHQSLVAVLQMLLHVLSFLHFLALWALNLHKFAVFEMSLKFFVDSFGTAVFKGRTENRSILALVFLMKIQ